MLNDETAIGRLIDDAEAHGAVALVIDTTSSASALLMEAPAHRQVPVAYVSGLVMRRAADLYAGAAKTDPKDAAVLADYARRNADRLTWNALSDELPTGWGYSTAEMSTSDATRTVNRLRDALLAVSAALERAAGDKLASNPPLRDALTSWGTPTALKAAGTPEKHSPSTPATASEPTASSAPSSASSPNAPPSPPQNGQRPRARICRPAGLVPHLGTGLTRGASRKVLLAIVYRLQRCPDPQ